MKSETDVPLAGKNKLSSRFATIEVKADENGEPMIVLSGDRLNLTGYKVGDRIDAIFQEGLVSLLRLD